MKDTIKIIGVVALVVAGVVTAAFVVPWINLQIMRIYGVETENVRTDIYRENKSYIEGTIRDLRELRREYESAEDDHKSAVRSLILHRAGEVDYEQLPVDLRSFITFLES